MTEEGTKSGEDFTPLSFVRGHTGKGTPVHSSDFIFLASTYRVFHPHPTITHHSYRGVHRRECRVLRKSTVMAVHHSISHGIHLNGALLELLLAL